MVHGFDVLAAGDQLLVQQPWTERQAVLAQRLQHVRPALTRVQPQVVPTEEALRAAAVQGAMLMGRAHELGAIEAGDHADLAAIDGDLLADIEHAIRDVCAVMKDGDIVVTQGACTP